MSLRKRNCCVPGCQDKISRRFSVPTNVEVRSIWIERIGSDRLLTVPESRIKNYVVCANHFLDVCFNVNGKLLNFSLPTINLQGFKNAPSLENSFFRKSPTPGYLIPKKLKDALESTSSKSTLTGKGPVGPVGIPSKVYSTKQLFKTEKISDPITSTEHIPSKPSNDNFELPGPSHYVAAGSSKELNLDSSNLKIPHALESTSSKSTLTGEGPVGPVGIPSKVYSTKQLFKTEKISDPITSTEHIPSKPSNDNFELPGPSHYVAAGSSKELNLDSSNLKIPHALESTSSKSTLTGEGPVGPVGIPSKVYSAKQLFKTEKISYPITSTEHIPSKPSNDNFELPGPSHYVAAGSSKELNLDSSNLKIPRIRVIREISKINMSLRRRNCCVPGCQDKISRRFSMPTNIEVRNIWIERTGSDRLLTVPESRIKNYVICANHFLDVCFNANGKLLNFSLPTINLKGFKNAPSLENSFLRKSPTPGYLIPKKLKDALESTSSKSTLTGEGPVGPVRIPSKVYSRKRLFKTEEISDPYQY